MPQQARSNRRPTVPGAFHPGATRWCRETVYCFKAINGLPGRQPEQTAGVLPGEREPALIF
jgi:hypothetical protein